MQKYEGKFILSQVKSEWKLIFIVLCALKSHFTVVSPAMTSLFDWVRPLVRVRVLEGCLFVSLVWIHHLLNMFRFLLPRSSHCVWKSSPLTRSIVWPYELHLCEQKSWGSYTWEIITLNRKSPQRKSNKLWVCVCSCSLRSPCHLLPPCYGCSVYFVFDLSALYPQLCVFVCACIRCVCVCVKKNTSVLPQDCFTVFRHNMPVFPLWLCVCKMYVNIFLRNPRDVFVWGNRKRQRVCILS